MAQILYSAFDVVPSPKGASTHITHFVRGLVGAGHELQLITPGTAELPERDEYEGAQMLRVPAAGAQSFLQRAVAFGEAVQAHLATAPPYQVAHYRSIWSGLGLAQAKAERGYKTLYEVNGLPSIELKYHYPALRGSALLRKVRAQELATLALSDLIVCPSVVTRHYLESLGVPPERIEVIPNGVSPRLFPATPLPAPRACPVLLYVGTLADWQGLELLLEALPRLLAEGPVRLHIVGRGRRRQRKTLLKQIRKRGLSEHVFLAEAVPHHLIPEVIAAADICVAPLAPNDRNVTQGCCPIKVLEYMAVGRPQVASNLPVVRELVREEQEALLYAPGDAEELAMQLRRLLEDRALAERLGRSAARRARSHFTWQQAQAQLVTLYERLVSRE